MSQNETTRPSPARGEGLFTPVQFLKGVGPQRAERLAKLGIRKAVDVLFHFPRRYQDYTALATPATIQPEKPISLIAELLDFETRYTRTNRLLVQALLEVVDPFGEQPAEPTHLLVTWFNQKYLVDRLQAGQRVLLQGTFQLDEDRYVATQPRISWLKPGDQPAQAQLLPVYALTDGIQQERMRGIVKHAVEAYAPLLNEVMPDAFRRRHQLLDIHHSVRQVHAPRTHDELQAARHRLIFQELLIQQLALAMRRKHLARQRSAPRLELTPAIRSRILNRFPFELSASQLEVIGEIAADMRNDMPMNRLLHGEVGSGKTIVAAAAILLAIACGYQAILMAPTEILVEQHVRNLQSWLKGSRVEIQSWTGSLTDRQRAVATHHIRDGTTQIVVGTQALANAELDFQKLGLIVIDEQHKFGVRQRAAVRSVDDVDPHYLVMTATPIPRTISMTLYGDLDVSTLQSDPQRVRTVHSYLGEEKQRESWWEFFRKKLREGRQGYVIAPLVESETSHLASVERLFEELTNGPLEAFRVDLLHGRLKSDEKLQIMHAFTRGHTQVLVATSVVEVGVDVPNATVMTVESAERFGLSQLHQLRGRISRGSHPGYVCVFPSSEFANRDSAGLSMQRLQAFVDSKDGFELAETDLKLRGPGDFFSSRQTGFPPLKIADLLTDQKILFETRQVAHELIDRDPLLDDPALANLKQMIISRYGKALELSDVG